MDLVNSLQMKLWAVEHSFHHISFKSSEWLSNILIRGESNFDEKKNAQSFIRKEVTFYKICILVV